MAILRWIMKILPDKTVLMAIHDFLKKMVESTPNTVDDKVLAIVKECIDLLYKLKEILQLKRK